MPFAKVEYYGEAVQSYLEGRWPIKPALSVIQAISHITEKAKLQLVKSLILDKWETLPIANKFKIIGILEEIFHQEKQKNHPQINQRIDKLKQALSHSQTISWKEVLLGVRLQKVQDKYYVSLKFDKNPEKHLQLPSSRFEIVNSNTNSYAIIGSTFMTNRKLFLENNGHSNNELKATNILDALYSVYTIDKKNEIDGLIIAIGDGSGGHMGEEQQDYVIAKTAHIATKHSIRLMAAFDEEEILKANLHLILSAVTAEIKRNYPKNQSGEPLYNEGTTLACGRAFINERGCRFIGFQIGDSMLMAWHPASRTLQALAPARVIVYAKSEGTAIVPTSYTAEEVQLIDTQLLEGSIILALTDGAYDYLPHQSKTGTYTDGRTYRETWLDEEAISQLLKPISIESPVATVIETLANQAVMSLETQRQIRLAEAKEAEQELNTKQAIMNENLATDQMVLDVEWKDILAKEAMLTENLNQQRHENPSHLATFAEQEKKLKQNIAVLKQDWLAKEKQVKQKHQQIIDDLQAKIAIQIGDDFILAGLKLPDFKIQSNSNVTHNDNNTITASLPRLKL